MVRVVILFNQSNTFGLSQDATLIETALKACLKDVEIVRADPLQPPSNADIVVHLEVPHPVWFPWAPTQIWMVNPEWCSPNWNSYKEQFTQIWVKESNLTLDFANIHADVVHIPWAVRGPLKPVLESALGLRQALWVLGASQNKHIAARALLPLWPSDFPITVTTSLEEADLPNSSEYPKSVSVKRGFLTAAELEELNQNSATHVAISAAEGFGYTAAQAEARSAAIILNTLPVYQEYYGTKSYTGFIKTPRVAVQDPKHCGFVADFSSVTTDELKVALQAIPAGESEVATSEDRFTRFMDAVKQQISICMKKAPLHVPKPPVLLLDDCPKISVLTLTYNRRNFIDLAFLNMLSTDYPLSKIQWVIVEDSDDPMKSASDKIKKFEERASDAIAQGFEITYVPMSSKRSIGYKRNRAVKAAKHAICVNMDDDDMYPHTSFRRRVGWLTSAATSAATSPIQVVGCTMIAMYDLRQGISAVNTPPWALTQSQRVSEASFCFYRAYALMYPFPDVQQSEGEGFIRDGVFLEIPPQQIVVALNHGTNTSGRVIAGRAQTGCFWGWDQKLITWLHGLVGVQVEAV